MTGTASMDAAEDRLFRHDEREAQRGPVRAYAILAGAVLLSYLLVNPLFFTQADEMRFSALLVPTLAVLGLYAATTYWSRYAELPLIDAAALLLLALLLMADNVILYGELNRIDPEKHANVAINGLIVSAFAAFALSATPALFRLWIALHAAAFVLMLLLLEATAGGRTYGLLSYAAGAAVMLFINFALHRAHRTGFTLRRALDVERAKTEELLYNVLPPAAAQRLRAGGVVADAFSDASVVFIDVVGFSRLARAVSPGHLVDMLNAFFSLADRCAAEHGVEKVKTIGDAYLAISGGNVMSRNSAEAALSFARGVIAALPEIAAATGLDVQVRIGIHNGPVVGGVIGATRMAYDYWGETMNVAARLEGVARPNGVALSESTYLRVRTLARFDPPESLMLKGVGEVAVYRLADEPATSVAGNSTGPLEPPAGPL